MIFIGHEEIPTRFSIGLEHDDGEQFWLATAVSKHLLGRPVFTLNVFNALRQGLVQAAQQGQRDMLARAERANISSWEVSSGHAFFTIFVL